MVESIRRRFRPTIKVSRKEGVTTYVEESAALRAGRKTAEVFGKIGSDVDEMLRIVPWKKLAKNRMFHTLVAGTIWYNCGGAELIDSIETRLLHYRDVVFNTINQLPIEQQDAPEETLVFAPTVVPTAISTEIEVPKQHLYYEVRKGDTLYSIARHFGTTVEALAEANQISNPSLIYPRQILYVISHVLPMEVIHDLLTPEERLKADKSYEGIYYHPGELNSSPERQEGLVHVYGLGEPLNPNYATGLPFEEEEFGCASWFHPFGTWLKVTNQANGEVVYCRVKDRGPNRVGYPHIIADLTKGARDEIAPSWVGEISVVIEPAK